jgi:hypothetical protein
MPLDAPNIVPQNNLRLPDALTIKYGPAPLLARFLLAADKAARRQGVTLRVRYDFDELLHINREYSARRLWYPLLDGFNPEHTELSSTNAVWVSGEDEAGEIVVTAACRVFDWTGTNLAAEARTVWYGCDRGQPCIVTAEAAERIDGVAGWGYGSWVRPDYRGKHLSFLIPKVLKGYVASRWPVDWLCCFIGIENVKKGLAASYGYDNVSHSIVYPGSPLGEQCVAYARVTEYYDAIANVMAGYGAVMRTDDFEGSSAASSIACEDIVTNTSADGVFHGNISLR